MRIRRGSTAVQKLMIGSLGVVVATLAACSSGGGAATGGSDEVSSSSSGAAATTAPSGDSNAEAALTLLQWHTSTPDTGLGKGFTQVGKDYEAIHPNQSVAFQATPFETFVAAGTTACRANTLASNVVLLPGTNFSTLFPCVETVTDATAGDLATELLGWGDAVVEPGVAGSYAGLPVGGQGTLFYYNKSLFEEAGLDPANPPKTWDEFVAACNALKAKGIDPIGASGADGYTPQWMFATFLAQMYPTTADVEAFARGDIKFNDPRTLTALQAVEETFTSGWWGKNYADQKFDAVEEDFINGRVAMVPGIITDIMNWNVWDTKMGKDAYGVFPGPVLPGSAATAQYFGPAILSSVAKDAENPAAANEFARYLASKEGQTVLLRDSGMFPNRTDIDVGSVTGSAGAASIAEILATVPTVGSITSWLNSEAYAEFGTQLMGALTIGDLEGYLDSVTKLQSLG